MTFPLMPHGIELALAAWGWTYVGTSNIGAAGVISTPPETKAGDLVVFHDTAMDTNTLPGEVVPTGFTKVYTNTMDRGAAATNRYCRIMLSLRIATQDGAVAISPVLSSTGALRRMVLVFRPSRPIKNVAVGQLVTNPGGPGIDANVTVTLNAPAAGAEGLPLVLFFARIWATSAVATVQTPTGMTEVFGSATFHVSYHRFGFNGPTQALNVSGDVASQLIGMDACYLLAS